MRQVISTFFDFNYESYILGLQSIPRELKEKDVAAMLVELTIEANEESFVIVLQHGGNDVNCNPRIWHTQPHRAKASLHIFSFLHKWYSLQSISYHFSLSFCQCARVLHLVTCRSVKICTLSGWRFISIESCMVNTSNTKLILSWYVYDKDYSYECTADKEYKWSDPRSYKQSPENIMRLQRDSNPWPPRYQCDALPTELWSLVGSRSGASSIYIRYMKSSALVEHRTGIAPVMGSNPVGASEFFLGFICNYLSYFTTAKIPFTCISDIF